MKVNNALNTFYMYCAILAILITAYYVEKVASENSVHSEFETVISLTGARLSDTLYGSMSKTGEWYNSGGVSNQLEFNIKNLGKVGLTNWVIYMEVPKGAKAESVWNVGVSEDKESGNILISPEYYNITIEPDSSISFGFVLKTSSSFYPTSIRFVGYRAGNGNSFLHKLIMLGIVAWVVFFTGYLVSKYNFRTFKAKQRNDVRIILQSMNTFISFIDAKDPYTRGHSRRVAMYAAEIAKRMGLSEDEVQNIYYCGLLHDAGKISVPDAVLNKPGKLTDEERKTIQSHTIAGGKMLKQLSSIKGIRETALYHHERYDGTGYPEGLKGDKIPLYARIVGVADSYDAMSSNRVYRRHLSKDEIIEEIQQGSGTQFDPDILKYMVDMINDGYVNVVKMETAENEEGSDDFHLREEDLPSIYNW
jgi:hypothetical protein